MPREADRIAEVSTSTGAGSLALSGVKPGYRTFLEEFGSGNTVIHYGIQSESTNEWEVGIGTFIGGSNVLQRDYVYRSQTGDKVAFSAGTKVIYVNHPAEGVLIVRARRSGDVGIDLIPAAGQSAPMIRVQREDGGDAFTVSATGGMRSGRLDIVASEPTLQLSDTAQTLPAGRWRWRCSGGAMILERSTSGNFVAAQTIMTLGGTGSVTIPRPTVISGGLNGTPIGQSDPDDGAFSEVELRDGVAITTLARTGMTLSAPGGVYLFNINGDEAARVVQGGSGSGGPTAIITREKGDARYAPLVSARWLKRDIGPPPLRDMTSLQPRGFTWDMDGHPRDGMPSLGFIADEVEAVIPEAVLLNSEGQPYGVDPLALLAALTLYFRERLDRIENRLGDLP